ncbi:hypothetical protein Q427_13840, partial [Halomonas sp. BC04]
LLGLTLASAIGLLALSGWFITASALTGMALAAGLAVSLDVHVPGGGIRTFAVTRTVARYVERLYNHDTVLRLLADLRGTLFAVMAGLDERTLARRRASDWLNRLTADIDTLDSLYLRLLAPPLVALLAILLLSGFLALWVPVAGLAVAALLLSAWLWLTAGQAWLGMAPSHSQVNHLQRLRSQAIEHLQGQAELEATAPATPIAACCCSARLSCSRSSVRWGGCPALVRLWSTCWSGSPCWPHSGWPRWPGSRVISAGRDGHAAPGGAGHR